MVTSDFTDKSINEKRVEWAWARKSDEAKEVRKLQYEFLETIKTTKKIAIVKKEKLKAEKTLKIFKQIEICKKHGGPLTPECLDIVQSLNNEQLLSEVSLLRLTTAPNTNIGQMRRKGENGKFRMEKFSDDELRTSLINAIQPIEDVSPDIEKLLDVIL